MAKKRYIWTVESVGFGETEEEAWENAIEADSAVLEQVDVVDEEHGDEYEN